VSALIAKMIPNRGIKIVPFGYGIYPFWGVETLMRQLLSVREQVAAVSVDMQGGFLKVVEFFFNTKIIIDGLHVMKPVVVLSLACSRKGHAQGRRWRGTTRSDTACLRHGYAYRTSVK
jgi:hypothetical protein